jgi:hypothetical protein
MEDMNGFDVKQKNVSCVWENPFAIPAAHG